MRIRLGYYFKEALDSFTRNWAMSFAAVMVVLISVLLVGTVFLMNHVFDKVASELEKRVEIEVFIKDLAPQDKINSFRDKIENFKEVKSIKYRSKDEAMKVFKERFKNNPGMIEEITGNPLPASYMISLKNPHDVFKVAQKIKNLPEKKEIVKKDTDIRYGEELVERLFKVLGILRMVMIGLIVVMILSALALISITVRLAIYARRKEIAVMRLVGASNWFIRFPFMLEGIIEGLTGAVLAILIIILTKAAVFSKVQQKLYFLSSLAVSTTFYQQMLVGLLLAGGVIGALGSTIAIRRYLRV